MSSNPSPYAASEFPVKEFVDAYIERKQKKAGQDLKKHGAEKDTTLFGTECVKTRRGVRLLVGPVIGKVTSTTAIVLLEVDACADIYLHLVPESGGDSIVLEKTFPERIPTTFYVQNLAPDTSYRVAIGWDFFFSCFLSFLTFFFLFLEVLRVNMLVVILV